MLKILKVEMACGNHGQNSQHLTDVLTDQEITDAISMQRPTEGHLSGPGFIKSVQGCHH